MPLSHKKVLSYGKGARRKGLMLKDIFELDDPSKWEIIKAQNKDKSKVKQVLEQAYIKGCKCFA